MNSIMSTLLFLASIVGKHGWAQPHHYLPTNMLHFEDVAENLNMSEEEFNRIIASVEDAYAPIIAGMGYRLKIWRNWESPIVNATAIQSGWTIFINVYGGLARRPEVTNDGFAIVICHELGHHLAGLPYRSGVAAWAAAEGQSDYFATLACARKIWQNDWERNKKALEELQLLKGGPAVKKRCDTVWSEDEDRHLCYRSVVAAYSLGGLSAYLKKSPVRPELDTPDHAVVEKTYRLHPAPQCRLDTYIAGALCNKVWQDGVIPARGFADKTDYRAMAAARSFGCFQGMETDGFRPPCWFNPKEMKLPAGRTILDEFHAKLERDDWSIFGGVFVEPYRKIKVTMEGVGDADLYVGLDRIPTIDDFDFRPLKFGSQETVEINSGNKVKNIYLGVQGWKSLSEVSLRVTNEFSIPLCLTYDGGQGESFPCLDGRSCKLIDSSKDQSQSNWCYFYLENKPRTSISWEVKQ